MKHMKHVIVFIVGLFLSILTASLTKTYFDFNLFERLVINVVITYPFVHYAMKPLYAKKMES